MGGFIFGLEITLTREQRLITGAVAFLSVFCEAVSVAVGLIPVFSEGSQ
jgi:hypothetical protein